MASGLRGRQVLGQVALRPAQSGLTGHPHRRGHRRRRDRTVRVRRERPGREIPSHCAELATSLERGHFVPRLYPPEVRRLIYTTSAIEALYSKIRRAVRTRGHFLSDEAAAKLIYLALNATSQECKSSVHEWHALKSQLAIMFEDRFPMAQSERQGTKICTVSHLGS